MKRQLLALLVLIFISAQIHAQDKIYRLNGTVIQAKVLEVGDEEIKYKQFDNQEGPIYVLETDRVKKIVYENGKVETFKQNAKDLEIYGDQRKQILKFNFFSPLYGYTEFGYERSVGYGRSIEVSLGLIGLGKSEIGYYGYNGFENVKREQAGAFISGGYKFFKFSDFVNSRRTRLRHLMQGAYVRPTLYLGHYKENQVFQKVDNSIDVSKQNITFGALQIELGKQWVFADVVSLDLFWGFGYGADNKKEFFRYENTSDQYFDEYSAFNYANLRTGKNPGFSLSFGLKIGVLIKDKKKTPDTSK